MAITVTNINVNLDTNKLGHKIDERFLQGNTDKNLVVRLLKNGENISVTDGTKPDITIVYYNANNTIANKFVYSPLKSDGSPNTEYTITGASGGIIEIPFTAHKAFADHAGRTDIILKLKDGNEYYTYSCTCYFDKNEAYDHGGIIDNFPKIDDIKAEITTVDNKVNTLAGDVANNKVGVAKIPTIQTDVLNLKTDNTQNKADISANKQILTTKANHDLSNVGEFGTAADGELLFKKDNTLKQSGIIVDTAGKVIHSPYSLEVPPNTLNLGSNISVHENGGFVEYETKTLGKDYILLDYENDPTLGSKKPIYYERGTKRTKVDIQPVDTTPMNNISIVNLGKGTMDKQVQAIYMKLVNSVTNLSFKITINGTDVGYYPSKGAWDSGKDGIDLASGLQKIDLKPYWTTLTEYTTIVTFKADNPINVLGNGTLPYFAQDLNHILRKEMALMDDLSNVDHTGLAKNDLTNVTDDTFLKKGVQAGLLQQDLADIDIQKLEEKYELTDDFKATQRTLSDLENELSDKAKYDLSNVSTGDMDKAIRLTNAYKQIVNRKPEHDGVIARHIEEQGPIDFSTISEKLIHVVYQITAEQEVITQTLPPLADDKTIIIEVLMSAGISDYSHIVLNPSPGDMINGSTTPLTLMEKGIQGILIPEASGSWIWIPYPMMHDIGIGVNDQKSNFFLGQQSIAFGAGFTATQDPTDNKRVKIDYTESGSGGNGLMFAETGGSNFTPKLVESVLKDIEIHKVDNPDGTFNANLNINPEVLREKHNEGILAFLGNDQTINSKYPKSKLYFGDTRVKGGEFVYEDLNTKSYIIQDIDPQDDPNVSGGSTFIIALYYEPDKTTLGPLTQDGNIELMLVDGDDNPIEDTNGNPMGVKMDYKAGETIRPELYIGECKAKASTEVHMKIQLNFATEEIVTVGANSCIMIQSISKDESSGLALLAFMAFTGYRIQFDTRYYGYNSMNLARSLVFDQAETDFSGSMEIGPNLFLDAQTNIKISISNYSLNINDDGRNIPVWNLSKVYDKLDSFNIRGKTYKVTTTIIDKDDAYTISLMNYTGTTFPAPKPKILSYSNGVPDFTPGWVEADSLFISEDAVQGYHTATKNFTIPDDAVGVAILMYPVVSQIPCNLNLKDLEGDITPWFNKTIITDSSHIKENILYYSDKIYRTLVQTPSGVVSYRYTVDLTNTKIPVGVVSGGDSKIVNDNSWSDAGSFDPNKTQGDLKFLTDGTVKLNYTARIFNETNTLNQVQFWLAKVNGDGTFTEVTNSRYATTIEANRNTPKKVVSSQFAFNVKTNETYRMFAKSDKNNGFYLNSETNGDPLFRMDIDFNELSSIEKEILDKTNEVRFMSKGVEVYDKILEYDVDTGKMAVKDK